MHIIQLIFSDTGGSRERERAEQAALRLVPLVREFKDGNGQTAQDLTLVFLETDFDLVVARGPENGETVAVYGQAPVRPACVSYVLLDQACAAIGIASVRR
jgi:hypothetical protein